MTTATTTRTKNSYPKIEALPIGEPDASGRVRVQIPDLPLLPEYFVRNKTQVTWINTSTDPDVKDFVLKPSEEKELPDPDYWLMNPKFRMLITDQEDDEGNERPSLLEVFKRTKNYKKARQVPEGVRCDQRYFADVDKMCIAPLEDALEHINIEPIDNNGKRNAKWIVLTWAKVLGHAQWRLNDMRRCGYEVDQRRLDAIEQRLEEIDNIRRATGLKTSTY